jgi:N-acetylglucosaminyl-diphospho-decaprenol L-rhamnosyltransferase
VAEAGPVDDAPPGPESPAPAWSAVVVNYEYGGVLLDAVGSLLADTSAGPVEVVVVDNGSADGSTAALRRTHPDVTIVEPGRNLGYAGGANAGIARAVADVVAVCNGDIVVAPGTAAAMVDRITRDPRVGAAGPMVREVNGAVYPSARRQPSVRDAIGHALLGAWRPDNPFTRRYHARDADPAIARDVDWVSGAAVWLRRAAVASVDGWDDGYFMYVEDVDLCWRLRRAGWRVVYEPAGLVTHAQGVATAKRPMRMIVEHHRSWYRFASKRWRGVRRLLLVPAAVFLTARAAVLVLGQAGSSVARRAWRTRSGASESCG